MATKNKPGTYDCYANAEPDEPLFTLLARDVHAPFLLRAWADVREASGEAPVKVEEARSCADAMERWNTKHRGRKPLSAQAVFDLFSRGEMMATLDPLAGLGELGGDLSGLDDDDDKPAVTQPVQPTEKRGPAVSDAPAASAPVPAMGTPAAKAATKPVAGEQPTKAVLGSVMGKPAQPAPTPTQPAAPPKPQRPVRSIDLDHTIIAGIPSEFTLNNVGSDERRFRPFKSLCNVKEKELVTIKVLSVGGQYLTFDEEKQTITEPDVYDFCRTGLGGTGFKAAPVVTANSRVALRCVYSGRVPEGSKLGDAIPFKFTLYGEAV